MGNARCHWVRGRLPLLVGDELQGLDRRRVERHLISCPQCRQHQAALGQVMTTLQTAAASPPSPIDAPSLWPALARQIRESRRPTPAPAPTFAFGFPLPISFSPALALTWLRVNARPWPTLGVGMGLGLLATVVGLGLGFGVEYKMSATQAGVAANRPSARRVPAVPPTLVKVPAAPAPRRELPAPVEPSFVETTPARRIFDLEHASPMPDPREARDTTATY